MPIVPWQTYLQKRRAFRQALDPEIIACCKTYKINLNKIASWVVSAQIIHEKRLQEIDSTRTALKQLKDRLKQRRRRAELTPASASANSAPQARLDRVRERLRALTHAAYRVEIDAVFRRTNSDASGQFLGQKTHTHFKFLKRADGLGGTIRMGQPPDVVFNRTSEALQRYLARFACLSIKDRTTMIETFLQIGRLSPALRSTTGAESFARRQRRIRQASMEKAIPEHARSHRK